LIIHFEILWLVLKYANSRVKNLAVFRPLRPSDGLTDQVP